MVDSIARKFVKEFFSVFPTLFFLLLILFGIIIFTSHFVISGFSIENLDFTIRFWIGLSFLVSFVFCFIMAFIIAGENN